MKASVTTTVRRSGGDIELAMSIRYGEYGERCFTVMRTYSPYTDPGKAFLEVWKDLKETVRRELSWEGLDGFTFSVPVPLPDTPPVTPF